MKVFSPFNSTSKGPRTNRENFTLLFGHEKFVLAYRLPAAETQNLPVYNMQ